MGDIHIHLKKQHLVIFISLIAILGVVLVINAYAPGESANPGIMGHSANELEVDVGSNNQNLQSLFNSILDDSGNINYANTAESANNVDWSNLNNKPSVIENSEDIATKDYVEDNAGIPDRSWHNVKSSRNKGQTYTNSRSYPIELAVTSSYGGSAYTNYCRLKYVIDGRTIIDQQNNNPSYSKKCSASITVPAGSTYRVVVDGYRTGEVNIWNELY